MKLAKPFDGSYPVNGSDGFSFGEAAEKLNEEELLEYMGKCLKSDISRWAFMAVVERERPEFFKKYRILMGELNMAYTLEGDGDTFFANNSGMSAITGAIAYADESKVDYGSIVEDLDEFEWPDDDDENFDRLAEMYWEVREGEPAGDCWGFDKFDSNDSCVMTPPEIIVILEVMKNGKDKIKEYLDDYCNDDEEYVNDMIERMDEFEVFCKENIDCGFNIG